MIGPEALKLGFKKTLVMTSGSLRGSDIVNKIVESMKYHGLDVVVYDKVESNPKDYNVKITDLFAEHRIEDALSLVLAGLPAGGMLDVDADSDYGTAFEQFLEQYGSAVTRRTTLLVLGDGRGNGNDPRVPVFEELSRRARQTVWLTPEPRYSWVLGRCDLPAYEESCDRVQVVRNLHGLERVTTSMSRAGR
jgi:uncharacterized protein with von Willebrand factor type A (vWA) domain